MVIRATATDAAPAIPPSGPGASPPDEGKEGRMKRTILLLIGLFIGLPACGGGGGGIAAGTFPITANTAQAIAELVVGGNNMLEETNLGLEELLSRLDSSDDGTFPCPDGGTYTLSSTSNSGTISFSDCMIDLGDGIETFDGTMTVRVLSSSTIEFTLDLTVTTGGNTASVVGDMRITYADLGGSSERMTLTGKRLATTSDGVTISLENYRYVEEFDYNSGDYSYTERGTLRDSQLGGSIYFRTLSPMEGTAPDYPIIGVLELRGGLGSVQTLTVVGDEITVETDEDGDGTIDDTFKTTWDELD